MDAQGTVEVLVCAIAKEIVNVWLLKRFVELRR